ncbi:MAG: ABC transporter permease subunit [Planctomycetales bacterium]|nr:ABC transporter permease subunit [Planctomycetales bacterium]
MSLSTPFGSRPVLLGLECRAMGARRLLRAGLLLAAAAGAAGAAKGLAASAGETFPVRNGFRALAEGLGPGLLVAGLVALLLGSQAIASDASEGSLRATLLRPAGRGGLVAAKAAALAGAGVALALAAAVGAALVGGIGAGFGDVVVLYEGSPVGPPKQTAALMLGRAALVVALSPLPVVAAAELGLAVSAFFDHAGSAASAALFLAVPVTLVSWLAVPGSDLLFVNPPARVVDAFRSLAAASATADWRQAPLAAAALVPGTTLLAAALAAGAVLRRRDILA